MARLTARERREAYLREYAYQKKTGKPFFPQVILHDVIVNLFFVLLIIALAILWHETANGKHSGILGPLYEDKADSAVAIYDPRPDWYYFFLFQLLRVFDNPNLLLLGTIIIPTIWMAILIGMPFIDRTRERRVSRRPIAIGFAGAMAVLLLTLTWKGSSAPNIEGAATATGPGIAFVKAQSCGSCHTLKAHGLGRQHRPEPRQREADYNLAVDAPHERRGADARVQGHAHRGADQVHRDRRRHAHQGRWRSPSTQAVACKGLLAGPDAPAGTRAARYPARVRFFLGITGASGAPYAARVLAGLTAAGAEVGVCASRAAGRGHRLRALPRPLARPGRGRAAPGRRARRRRRRRCTPRTTGSRPTPRARRASTAT